MDYVDSSWVVSLSMYRNRLRAYRKMGYEVEEPDTCSAPRQGRNGRYSRRGGPP